MSTTLTGAPAPVQGEPHSRRFTGRLVVGLALVAFGVAFLLDNLGLMDAGVIWKWWPIVFLLIGIAKVVNAVTARERMAGLIWLTIGGFLLAGSLDLIDFNVWRMFWPVVIILFGLNIVGRSLGRSGGGGGGAHVQTASSVSAFAVMSGVDRRVATRDFRGGDATAVMGGCEVDLRQSDITHGPAVFDVFALMGGIDLRVPGTWTVKDEGLALMGGFEDSRKETAEDPSKVLIIRGVAIMGGVEIKN